MLHHTHLKCLYPSLFLDEFYSRVRLHLHILPLQLIHQARLVEKIRITAQHLRRKGSERLFLSTQCHLVNDFPSFKQLTSSGSHRPSPMATPLKLIFTLAEGLFLWM